MHIQYPHGLGTYPLVILLLLVIHLWLTSKSKFLTRRETQELFSWLIIDCFALAALIAFWTPAFSKDDPQKNFLILAADVSAIVLIWLRVRTRLHFFHPGSPGIDRSLALQKGGIEISFRWSDTQALAIRQLIERILSSNVLEREGDTLQDIGHMVGALQAIQAALDEADRECGPQRHAMIELLKNAGCSKPQPPAVGDKLL